MARSLAVPVTLLLVACSNDHSAAHQKPDGPPIGHWEKLPQGPSDATLTGQAFSDHEYITWSGNGTPPTPYIFNAATGEWRTGSSDGCPKSRLFASGVWTGSEVIFWGGEDNSYYPIKDPGGAYNPATDSWRVISSANAPSPREWVNPVWAETEMIIWGGADTISNYNSPPILNDAYAYNPLTDTWRTVPFEGAPSPRINVISAWTGSELLIWGGTADSNTIGTVNANRAYLKSGAAYNPTSNTWRPMASVGAPSQDIPIASAWTGTELLVWNSSQGEGAAYNPKTDTWRPMDGHGPLLRYGACAIWSGKYFLVCGDNASPEGELYDPTEDRWYLMESQLVDSGPGPWSSANGYEYNGSVYIFGGLIGGNYFAGDLWGYRYVITSEPSDAQP